MLHSVVERWNGGPGYIHDLGKKKAKKIVLTEIKRGRKAQKREKLQYEIRIEEKEKSISQLWKDGKHGKVNFH